MSANDILTKILEIFYITRLEFFDVLVIGRVTAEKIKFFAPIRIYPKKLTN